MAPRSRRDMDMSDYKAIKQTIRVFMQSNSPTHPVMLAKKVMVTFLYPNNTGSWVGK
jgi:hypothetical protein